jgi:hypothetical protein
MNIKSYTRYISLLLSYAYTVWRYTYLLLNYAYPLLTYAYPLDLLLSYIELRLHLTIC